VLKAQS